MNGFGLCYLLVLLPPSPPLSSSPIRGMYNKIKKSSEALMSPTFKLWLLPQ